MHTFGEALVVADELRLASMLWCRNPRARDTGAPVLSSPVWQSCPGMTAPKLPCGSSIFQDSASQKLWAIR